ncbi:MAG TPA: glycosyltransferase [Cyclobacteriaceae bacterium]
MIKVLYLSYDGLTDPLGQSQILPYLCGLSNEYSITIVSFEKRNRYEVEKELIEGICSDNSIQWIPLVYHKNPPVISTLYDLWRLRSVSAMLHRNQDFKIVHCRSYLTSLVGLWMKNKYHTKFIFDMRGFWADERVEGGLWNLSNIIYKSIFNFFKKKERQFLKNADATITLTYSAKDQIFDWGFSSHIYVIPCCVDLDHFNPAKIDPIEKINLKQELGIAQDDFVLLYLGSLGTWYLVDEMKDFFYELRKTTKTKFLLVTPDEFSSDDADVIVRKVSRKQVPLFISIANASIMLIKNSFSKKASSATKMAEVMAMNIPVLSNPGWGDVDTILKEGGGHLIADAGSTLKSIEASTCNSREYCLEYFSLEKGIKTYKEVYEELVKK